MDRLDRSLAPPVGPMGRSLSDNPIPGRRPIPNSTATSNGLTPIPLIPALRQTPSNSNLSVANAMPASQIIALAREAMRNALESEGQVGDAGAVGVKTGVTIDLSRKNIYKLPEEVVDIVKDELERLALSHNQLSYLPRKFSECTSLRYLNIRANNISEFPMPVCELKSLEILDLGRNMLKVLPSEIARLTSLKVLSVRKNQIRELPHSLADMVSLQVLKFEGNPLIFPPKDAMPYHPPSPSGDGIRDSEKTEIAVTAHIKRFLRQHSLNNGRLESEQTGDESSEGAEMPRMAPLKRRVSGRFPIKVNGADPPEARSPHLGRAPPVPQRSHYRGLSQQNTSTRRPGVMPLTLGNANERLRSNSETILRERSESRNRRMGLVTKKTSDLSTLDETQAHNRLSHYRGLSHGSAMQGASVGGGGNQEPGTPGDSYPQRPVYVRRLSVLPERRRESKIFDPILEAAKGILYSLFQIHPMIQALMSLTSDGSAKRSSLEIVFYNTVSHVEELEQEIQKHEAAIAEGSPSARENEHVHRACQTLVSAYGHVCTLLADNIDTFVDNGDPRYIRTLLMLIYNSIMEIRVTLSSVSSSSSNSNGNGTSISEETKYNSIEEEPTAETALTLKPHVRDASITPTPQRLAISRSRNGTMMHSPVNLRVATDVPMPSPYTNGLSRTAILGSATPRSGESFMSIVSREIGSDGSAEEDAQFDKIFLSLQRSADIVLRTLPNFNIQLTGGLKNAINQSAPGSLIRDWKALIGMCGNTIQQTEIMRSRLSMIKLKEPGVRTQASFWNLCSNFIASWTELVTQIRGSMNNVPLPPDTRIRLRPIQQSMKDTSNTIVNSPWHHLLTPGSSNIPMTPGLGPMSPSQIPITPQSAALGPAMQATVPKTPQMTSFAAAFQGNVFDRADALMANPGISMSRPGTSMRRNGHSGLNSLSSVSSHSSNGDNGLAFPMSPGVGNGGPLRINGGRSAF